MNRHLPAVVLAVVAVGGCRAAPVVESVAADRARVEASTTAFHQALRINDLETFMSYVAEDVLFMPPGEPAIRGRDAVRTWMTGFLAQYRTSSLTLAEREVLVGNGWAVELGTFEWEVRPATGGAAVVDRGNYMQVWRQQDDKTWRFAREVYNSSIPPARPAEWQAESSSQLPGSELEKVANFLVASAANDFHAHRPPDPARFRNVRIGHVVAPSGEKRYTLCGQFLPAAQEGSKAEWTSFATIKTSGYEQWLGTQAEGYCGPSVTWDRSGDLSSSLQTRLDSLR